MTGEFINTALFKIGKFDTSAISIIDPIPSPKGKLEYDFVRRLILASSTSIHLILADDSFFTDAINASPTDEAGIHLVEYGDKKHLIITSKIQPGRLNYTDIYDIRELLYLCIQLFLLVIRAFREIVPAPQFMYEIFTANEL